MSFIPHTQDELKQLNIQPGKTYTIEYINKDYYNGEETIEKEKAVAIINDGVITFIVKDPMGMEKYVTEVKVIKWNY